MTQITKARAGRTFTRCAMGLAVAGGDPAAAIGFTCGRNWTDEPQIVAHHKAVMSATSMADMPATVAAADYVPGVRARTVLPQLPGARYVPLSIRTLDAIAGSGCAFVGEGAPIPVSKMDLQGDTMQPLKAGSIVVLAKELVRSSTPSAEALVQEDLTAASAQGIDVAFLDPTNAGVPGVSPASVTYGIPQRVSSGPTVANIYSDLGLMTQDLVRLGSTLKDAVWIVRPEKLVSMCGMHNASGALAFPNLTVHGGTLMGLPVIAAANLPPPGSPAASYIVLLDGSQVVVGDEAQAEVAISTAAALQMDDAPTTASIDGTATTMVSLYQLEAVAIRVIHWINWKLRRPYVSVLSGVTF